MSLNTSNTVNAIQATVAVDRFGISATVPNTGAGVAVSPVARPPERAATERAPEPVQLAQAVDDLNQRFRDSRTDLRFSVDDDSGRTVVSVVDAEDGRVLRQMPTVEALRVSKALDQALGNLIQRLA
ncbi:flagellar protein FlaG [Nevskia sp.]|uniref:flagellar protein FlaG n=1 Tax=Nevskia sp. TaxID=1929292 RepID=UPI0025CC2886|nr:flagellar protein FlaG [Nevskia sp.]